jgi:hypothetical protein
MSARTWLVYCPITGDPLATFATEREAVAYVRRYRRGAITSTAD